MRLVLDNREPPELIAYIKNYIDKREDKKPIDFSTKSLDIGDAIIYLDETDLMNPNKQVFFERKALGDLVASLKDGRYNEQSFRLSNYPVHNHNIYYIIEGNIEKFVKTPRNIRVPTMKQTIYSTMVTLSYYKGFSLINTQNIEETATFIYRFLDKIMRENKRIAYYTLNPQWSPDETIETTHQLQELEISNESQLQTPNTSLQLLTTTSSLSHPHGGTNGGIISSPKQFDGSHPHAGGKGGYPPQYSDCIKTTKKSNITMDNILEIMLMQIPDVCPAAAQVISTKFGDMKNLIDNLENDPECLDEIVIKQNRVRKITKNAKKNIFKYILQKEQTIVIPT